MPKNESPSNLFEYLITQAKLAKDNLKQGDRLATLNQISEELGLGVSTLREQLEVARAIGLVEVHPRTGIRRLPYNFSPAVRLSLNYAVAIDWENFLAFADLRNHLEAAYWNQAVTRLLPDDFTTLQRLMAIAWEKLRGQPIQIPHLEHRQLHLCIYSRLENPFVLGLLEAFWDSYEAVGLNLYTEYRYLEQVWKYHQQMVDAICVADYGRGYQALIEHRDLLFQRSVPSQVSNGTTGHS